MAKNMNPTKGNTIKIHIVEALLDLIDIIKDWVSRHDYNWKTIVKEFQKNT